MLALEKFPYLRTDIFERNHLSSDKSVHFRHNWCFWHQQRLAFLRQTR